MGQPSGSSATKCIGWIQKDGHGGPITKRAAASDSEVAITEGPNGWARPANWVKPVQRKTGTVREGMGIGPYPAHYGRRSRGCQSRNSSRSYARSRRAQSKASTGSPVQRRAMTVFGRHRHADDPKAVACNDSAEKSLTVAVDPNSGESSRPVSRAARPASATGASQSALSRCEFSVETRRPRPQSAGALRIQSALGVKGVPDSLVESKPQSAGSLRIQSALGVKADPDSLAESRRSRPKTAGALRIQSSSGLTADQSSAEARRRRPQSAPIACNRAGSVPAEGGKQVQQIHCLEEGMQKAFSRSRGFLNGSSLTRNTGYYHPLSQSDVSHYANAYTATWKKSLYQKDSRV